jgi:predicted ferric reductase
VVIAVHTAVVHSLVALVVLHIEVDRRAAAAAAADMGAGRADQGEAEEVAYCTRIGIEDKVKTALRNLRELETEDMRMEGQVRMARATE